MTPQKRRFTSLVSGMAVIMLLVGAVPLLAQTTGSITGAVMVQSTGRPLSGVRIQLIGTTRSTSAGVDGSFEMQNVAMGTYRIRASIIGYASLETTVTVTAGQPAAVNFSLNRASISLDEIVVTGTAGATEKRSIGNSVAVISAANVLEVMPVGDVQEMLQARTPGLTILANTGQAGASSSIRIRGAATINAGIQPVFYIDGIRFAAATQDGFSTGNGVVQGTSPLDFINPNDIESIEVIKGPSATTLYGADAASGVVQIITKKGRTGTPVQWTANFEVGESEWTDQVGQPTNFWLCTASNIADPVTYPGCSGFDPAAPGEQRTLTDNPVKRDPRALRKGGAYDFNLSVRGGGQEYNYFVSFERMREDGVFFNNFARRQGGRANFGFTPSEQLNFNVNLGYTQTHTRQPWNNNSSNGILRNGFRGRAGALDDPWATGFRGLGPAQSNQYDNQTRAERTTIGVTANFNPTSWFSNKLTLGMDKQDRRNTQFYEIDTTGMEPFGSTNATGTIRHFLPVTHLWTIDYSGTISVPLNDNFESKFSAGMQLNAAQRKSTSADGEGLVANALNLVSAAAVTFGGESFSSQTSLGFYLQEQVSFKDRLYGTVAVRIDDNSAFGSDFSLVVYPKASVSYVISDEDFFNLGFVDQLKVRGAWGRAGNAPPPFTADRTFTSDVTTVMDESVNALTPSSFGNPNLKSETGSEIELGFDASMFDGRAGLEFTFYDQSTKDALISVPDPPSSGFTGSHLENVGDISNQGIEILLTATPILGRNFAWDASLSVSGNKNRLDSFSGARDEITFGAFASVQRHREGFPLGGFWAVDVERDSNGVPVLTSGGSAIVANTCTWTPNEPGWDQATDCEEIFMGSSVPTREAALTSTFTMMGNLRLYFQFDYKGGGYQWCAICSIRNRVDRNSFEVNDPNSTPEEIARWRSRQTLSHIFKSDFIKWRELSLSYSFPRRWAQALQAERVSFTLSGRNLLIWTKYEGTGDPEVSFYSRRDFTKLDYASLPMVRRVAASVRVVF